MNGNSTCVDIPCERNWLAERERSGKQSGHPSGEWSGKRAAYHLTPLAQESASRTVSFHGLSCRVGVFWQGTPEGPEEHFKAVAEVIGFVTRLNNRAAANAPG